MGFLFGMLLLAVVIGTPIATLIALSRTREMQSRIERLEQRVEVLLNQARRAAVPTSAEPARPHAAQTAAPATVAVPPATQRPGPVAPPAPAGSMPTPTPASTHAPAPSRSTSTSASPSQPRAHAREEDHPVDADWFDLAVDRIKGWFAHGNVPVKVGMVVLFAGVAALLKYAADQGWMRFPIEWRLGGIAVLALAGLVFGWQQRHVRRTFALSVQGGAIGVLLMTAFAAYKLYGLLDPALAFAAWVLLAAAAGLLSAWQEERALAVLGILAGFLAPVLMNTGAGNHVVLFSFYAILNAAIFAIAWYRAWRELNLLGFVFTFGIGTWWGVLHYEPEKLATTLPFLLLFFMFYLLLPLLHARRQPPGRPIVDACLVFGTPLVAFAQLAALLEGDAYPLAASALGLGALYALLALVRRGHAGLLQQAHLALAIGFATLAVPLALSAEATASVFALEGAALVWFGTAQARAIPRWAGLALQVLAAVQILGVFEVSAAAQPLANPAFMGMLLLSLSGLASAWATARAGDDDSAGVWYLWGLAWWVVAANREIGLHVEPAAVEPARLGLAALTAAAAALALRLHRGAALPRTIAAALAAALPLALLQAKLQPDPFAGPGLAMWVAYALLGAFALHALRRHPATEAVAVAHAAWLLALVLAAALWLRAISTAAGLASGWRDAAFVLPWLLTGALLVGMERLMTWPLQVRFEAWRTPLLALWQMILIAIGLALLVVPGDVAPLPFVPLFNPVDLMLLGIATLLAVWCFRDTAPAALRALRAPVLAGAVFLLATSVTLRAVHQLADAPWHRGLFDTAVAQASLSLVWSVLGVAGWVVGSRRRRRELWLVGAVLMAVVLAKLVLVDRVHLGNLPGIASFIGYGLLCTLVGYLAPAPPRGAAAVATTT